MQKYHFFGQELLLQPPFSFNPFSFVKNIDRKRAFVPVIKRQKVTNMTFWIHFRIVQSWRMLQRAGVGMVAAAALLLLPFGLRVAEALPHIEGVTLVAGWWLAAGMLHAWRNDRFFLEQGQRPAGQYVAADYLLLSLPVVAGGMISGQWMLLAAPAAALWALLPPGWLNRRQSSKTPPGLPRWMPAQAIEWYFLLRGQWAGWGLAVLLLAGTVFHFAFYIAAAATGLLLLGAAFEYLEPFAMFPDSRSAFIRRWRAGANMMYVWLIPGTAVLLAFQAQWWPLGMYVWADYEIFWFFALNYKYAVWAPGRRRLYGSAAGSVAMLFALVPGGIIGLMMMAVWYAIKAKRVI